MDIQIKYDKGQMVVHLEEFLNCRSISKFRKLIKLVQQSDTPEEIEKVRSYLLSEVKSCEKSKKFYEFYSKCLEVIQRGNEQRKVVN